MNYLYYAWGTLCAVHCELTLSVLFPHFFLNNEIMHLALSPAIDKRQAETRTEIDTGKQWTAVEVFSKNINYLLFQKQRGQEAQRRGCRFVAHNAQWKPLWATADHIHVRSGRLSHTVQTRHTVAFHSLLASRSKNPQRGGVTDSHTGLHNLSPKCSLAHLLTLFP